MRNEIKEYEAAAQAAEKFVNGRTLEVCGQGLQSELQHHRQNNTMQITVITGSPRANGNTSAMVEAFIKAARAR